MLAHYRDDQGETAWASGPEVTDNGYSLATDGDYGLRLVQAIASDDPGMYVLVAATDMDAKGAEVAPLLKEAQAAILVNEQPPLMGLDQFIEPAS